MGLLLLASVMAVAVCSNSAGGLFSGATLVERMAVAGVAVVAIMGIGTDLVIRLSER
ncbi:hypothetical protein [Methanomassiliicoccus luminyensis]|uniref:hypothetical protein n=1 Tax=Methanomassiliicoccus luminyensis TaxID=1080712 RepID=UPI0003821B52|nr:hypothetical protein [Methanomassiliicoccus luminyensis]